MQVRIQDLVEPASDLSCARSTLKMSRKYIRFGTPKVSSFVPHVEMNALFMRFLRGAGRKLSLGTFGSTYCNTNCLIDSNSINFSATVYQ